MPLRKLIAVLLILFPGLCFAKSEGISQYHHTLDLLERHIWTPPARETEFATIGHTTGQGCSATREPEALATPSPLLEGPNTKARIKVTFIIGTDGRVHSPYILESAGPVGDQVVLDAVRAWRYRPAMCNGMPTETEAKIGFSGR
jgi:Gram-negative bacterial TonB protein C-terminal